MLLVLVPLLVVLLLSGGENDTMAEVLEDRLQGHWHITNLGDGLDTIADANQVQGKNTFQTAGTNATRDPIDDGTNGTPKTGLTTRPKELTTAFFIDTFT